MLFLDTSRFEEIEKFHAMGIIRGVTTNPTIMKKEGAVNISGMREAVVKIAKLIAPYSVSVEVTSNDDKQMLEQALEFAGWAKNIVVKIPIHGPEGETGNLNLIKELEQKRNVRVNVTAMMNAQQGYLAAMAGATYVSLFCGRIQDMGYDAGTEIRLLRQLLDQGGMKSQIIAGSVREVKSIIDWLAAGSHIVTAAPQFLSKMIQHPYTAVTVKEFLRDAAATPK